LAEEAHFFKTEEIQGIVCDIPFLPFTAASRWGIPAIGIGNFTWDWVYDAYAGSDARWSPLVSWIRQSQQGCSLFLQLPMHGDCSSCPAIRPVPLVARRATKKPEQTRKILGLESQQKAYLVSFVALDLKEEALARLQRITNAVFLYRHPLSFRLKNGICLDDFDISYSDVVAAVDGVITKPGYGIVSECLVHGTPMIYADRGLFPEYGILVKEMEKHLTALYLPSRDLYAGRWEAAVRKLENEPRRFPVIQDDGAQVCAETILGFLAR
jgi:L-arabinokinase